MKKLEARVRDYFGFSKVETRGTLVLLLLLACLLILPTAIDRLRPSQPFMRAEDRRVLDSLVALFEAAETTAPVGEPIGHLAYFDPNTANQAELEGLGFPSWLAERLIKYRAGGGSFRQREDLKRLYGFPESLYDRVAPYIRLPETDRNFEAPRRMLTPFDPNTATQTELEALGFPGWLAERTVKYRTAGGSFRQKKDLQRLYGFPEALYEELAPYIQLPDSLPLSSAPRTYDTDGWKPLTRFDANQADTTQWKRVRGIGSGYAQRIVKFRESLGGFTTATQLREVYGLPDSVRRSLDTLAFVATGFIPQQIPINSVTAEELGAHPYLSARQARALVSYRDQHGAFTVETLEKARVLSPEDRKRLLPYLDFE